MVVRVHRGSLQFAALSVTRTEVAEEALVRLITKSLPAEADGDRVTPILPSRRLGHHRLVRDLTVNSGDVQLAVRDFGGDGEPLVLLHGLGRTLADCSVSDRYGHGAAGSIAKRLGRCGEHRPDPTVRRGKALLGEAHPHLSDRRRLDRGTLGGPRRPRSPPATRRDLRARVLKIQRPVAHPLKAALTSRPKTRKVSPTVSGRRDLTPRVPTLGLIRLPALNQLMR
jgi:hypothetical protein